MLGWFLHHENKFNLFKLILPCKHFERENRQAGRNFNQQRMRTTFYPVINQVSGYMHPVIKQVSGYMHPVIKLSQWLYASSYKTKSVAICIQL